MACLWGSYTKYINRIQIIDKTRHTILSTDNSHEQRKMLTHFADVFAMPILMHVVFIISIVCRFFFCQMRHDQKDINEFVNSDRFYFFFFFVFFFTPFFHSHKIYDTHTHTHTRIRQMPLERQRENKKKKKMIFVDAEFFIVR